MCPPMSRLPLFALVLSASALAAEVEAPATKPKLEVMTFATLAGEIGRAHV